MPIAGLWRALPPPQRRAYPPLPSRNPPAHNPPATRPPPLALPPQKECGLHSGNVVQSAAEQAERESAPDLWQGGAVETLSKQQMG